MVKEHLYLHAIDSVRHSKKERNNCCIKVILCVAVMMYFKW